mgnify:FL=1|tara:strand:+ start:811 stop:1242 length:432 start_codon:yes stop_codon:yes gene_type:complete
MGTRSLTTFVETYKDNSGKKVKNEIVTMYRQYDGYMEGHGKDLADFLAGGELVDGFGMDDKVVFNGMGCLSAQVVAHFKDGTGGIYLQRANKNSGENYRYKVIGDLETKEITIEVFEVGNRAKKIFSGSPKQLQEKVAEVVES